MTPCGATDPSGSPRIARRCCSNCDVAAPSIDQWPLLCTRGASSLIISPPPRSWNSSTVSTPTRSSPRAMLSAISRASLAMIGSIGAGATLSARIPASWTLRETGKASVRPVRSRAHTTESSASKSISRSSSSGRPSTPPRDATRGRDLATRGDPDLRAAVVAAERELEPDRVAQGLRRRLRFREASDLAPRRGMLADVADEPPLRQPVLGGAQRGQAGAQRGQLAGGRGRLEAHVLQLVGDDVAHRRQATRGLHVVVPPHDDLVGDGGGGAGRVRVEGDQPVAHGAGREPQHPAQLPAAQDADGGSRREGRRRVGRTPPDPEAVQRIDHEVALAQRVQLTRVALPGLGHDPLLGRGVGIAERRVGAEGVPEQHLLAQLPAGRRHHVAVDAERRAVVVHETGEHRPGRRERGEAPLAAEPEREQRVDQERDLVRRRLDPEVHDVLAGQAGDGGAADVLHDGARPRRRDQAGDLARDLDRPRVPRVVRGREALVGTDGQVRHRGQV